ncbi:MAG: hypothetical protein ABR927_13005 [Bacteroidales bacterium]|jgi:hypothetical protein
MQKTTGIIAWIALIISLTGGVPGIISAVKFFTEKPKLNFMLRNLYCGGIGTEKQSIKSFALLILTIGNEGHLNFKRLGNPIIEANIKGEWVKFQVNGTSNEMIEGIPDDGIRNIIKMVKVPDYYWNNLVIPPNESIDVFLFGLDNLNKVSPDEIRSTLKYRVTLRDVKNRKYSQIVEIR